MHKTDLITILTEIKVRNSLAGLRTREIGTVGDQLVFSTCRISSSRRASTLDLLQLRSKIVLEQ